MNPIVLYFASGESLYPGTAILMLAILISPFLRHRWLLRLRNVATWLALIMIIMACPPFPWTVDVVFVATFLLWYVATSLSVGRRAQRLATAFLAALLIVLSGFELQHRSPPLISGMPSDHLVVIGDSISAGIDPRIPPWPAVMQATTGVRVKNLSSAGAFMVDALRMSAKVESEDRVVLMEMGETICLRECLPFNSGDHSTRFSKKWSRQVARSSCSNCRFCRIGSHMARFSGSLQRSTESG
jgi:hypothetical protein